MNKLRSVPLRLLLIFTIAAVFTQKANAQAADTPVRIAVLAPLYIDSAFDNTTYKLSNTSMPRYILPGLEFYNGVMMAVDSLQKQGQNIDLWVYDTKKKDRSIDALANEMAPLHFSLIIASLSNLTEQKRFSEFSFANNVPLVSATYPNDAYVTGNPFFIMLNSTLRTHVEGLYKYLQRSYPVAKFLYVTRKGSMEEKMLGMYADAGKKTYPINYKIVELPDNFTQEQVLPLLDSNKQNVVICGSLDENFSTNLIRAFDENITYPVTLAGAPTWDGLRQVLRTQNENVSIVYSTPFNYPKIDLQLMTLSNQYRLKFNSRASDMVFKGYESMTYFSKLLLKYHNDFLNNLSDTKYKVANSFLLQPVKLTANAQVPDYIENKHLYFITRNKGVITAVN